MSVTSISHERRVRRALIPVGGRGTRMYPATASVPKELLPIGNRPLLEFALDEIAAAGLSEVVLVTARGKSSIEDFVEDWSDRNPNALKFAFVRQRAPNGLGDAVATAEHLVGDAPFAVILPDDLLVGADLMLGHLVQHHYATGGAVIALQPISDAETSAYGVPEAVECDDRTYAIARIAEKPGPERAASRLGIVGRYVLPSRIFRHLETMRPGAKGEIQLTDAIDALARAEGAWGLRLTQRRIDCGSPAGFLEAQLSSQAHCKSAAIALPRGQGRLRAPATVGGRVSTLLSTEDGA